ncbi:hypothetical protein CGCSCA4_v001447 [Colletotrichum siamense]|uniref:Uncharacterized protein n=1 Tax=Colletotrichum siamense TaxID=690259 RepID=A0A9P5F1X5_COLSI|nr:hypothetical protein CGCSCA4_v001447 [Colletotrichum siamense]KAF4865528.1 hypothetical protein CGCSCA2_v001525 [Colletotrichum siamense]
MQATTSSPAVVDGSTANYDGAFSREQRWVNSKPKAFRFDSRNSKTGGGPQAQDTNNESPISNTTSLPDRIAVNTALHEAVRNLSETPDVLNQERRLDDIQSQRLPTPTKRRRTETVPHDGGQFLPASPSGSGTSGASPWSTTALPTGRIRLNEEPHVPSPHATGPPVTVEQFSPSADSYHQPSEHDPVGGLHTHPPNDGIQEACLLRYFTEELSQWFDLCDEERHFQLIVTRRARACQPLRDATLAVAARHLCRHPRFRTEPGGVIVYQNQLLPDLTPQSAIEYMLRCIPALHEVSRTQDEEYRENLAAAALILRQFEEMDPEEAQSATSSDFGNGIGNVNFLDITKAILRAAPSRWSGLLSAVYWVAVRQEIYFALTLERSPQISAQPPDLDRDTCFANKLIWFMSEVAKWKMGERSGTEWERLRNEEEVLIVEAARQFIPIVQRPADRSRGEIFPLVWYGSDIEVTALQHFILARMILVAEDPSLHGQVSNRRAQRDAEHQVRAMILELCGLALHHLRAPPNLTTAGMGIMLYGDYFNDPVCPHPPWSFTPPSKWQESFTPPSRRWEVLKQIYDENLEEELAEAGYYHSPIPWKTIVQPAPSHDGAPTFAAYQVFEDTPEDLSPEDLEVAVRPLRPPFGIVVYDTTHTARPARSARLARAVFDRTFWYRRRPKHRPDRVEVVTLPLPQSFTDAERAEACIRHHEEELRSRLLIHNVAEAVSWFLPGRIMESTYARRILAINRLEENDNDDEVDVASWEESISNEEYAIEHEACMHPEASRSGSFLCIDWQPRKELWRSRTGRDYNPDMHKEMITPCYGFEMFGNICMELVDAVEVFYNHFVPDGILDLELDKARRG